MQKWPVIIRISQKVPFCFVREAWDEPILLVKCGHGLGTRGKPIEYCGLLKPEHLQPFCKVFNIKIPTKLLTEQELKVFNINAA